MHYSFKVLFLFLFLWVTSSQISCKQVDTSKVKDNVFVTKMESPIIDTVSFQKGIVIKAVNCLADSQHSYALYLPSSYTKNQIWPVIYFYDSHASGSLPIEKYKDLAEKYGFIMVGSNQSKNGQTIEECTNIIQKFTTDVSSRFSIDKGRMYTAGFSGGSRVAVMAAMTHKQMRAVIGCGAGFPSTTQSSQPSFEFIGIAGNEDFNYTELKRLDKLLDEKGLAHQLLVFDGKHDWPPVPIMEQAIWWIECNAMREGKRSVDKGILVSVQQMVENELTKAQKKNHLPDVYFTHQKAIHYLYDLIDVSTHESEITSMKAGGKLQEMLNAMAQSEQLEASMQQQYTAAFASQQWAWWEKEIDRIYRVTKTSKNSEEVIIHKRLLSYLSLVAYMFSSNALKANQLFDAELCLKIYEKVDPQNPEYAYLFAQLYMKQNNSIKVIAYLKKAVKLGFCDVKRLSSDSQFLLLKDQKEFKSILLELKKYE